MAHSGLGGPGLCLRLFLGARGTEEEPNQPPRPGRGGSRRPCSDEVSSRPGRLWPQRRTILPTSIPRKETNQKKSPHIAFREIPPTARFPRGTALLLGPLPACEGRRRRDGGPGVPRSRPCAPLAQPEKQGPACLKRKIREGTNSPGNYSLHPSCGGGEGCLTPLRFLTSSMRRANKGKIKSKPSSK